MKERIEHILERGKVLAALSKEGVNCGILIGYSTLDFTPLFVPTKPDKVEIRSICRCRPRNSHIDSTS